MPKKRTETAEDSFQVGGQKIRGLAEIKQYQERPNRFFTPEREEPAKEHEPFEEVAEEEEEDSEVKKKKSLEEILKEYKKKKGIEE